MKILSASQIREADQYTISNEPVSSLDLMERAAGQLFTFCTTHYSESTSFHIFCGMGNNGGDGLALARMLIRAKYKVLIYIIHHSGKGGSEDFQHELSALESVNPSVQWVKDAVNIPDISEGVVVDALLGSGLNRPLEGLLLKVVKRINGLKVNKISIDIPTGMWADDNSDNDPENILKADITLTFQLAKQAFFHRSTAALAGDVHIMDIQLNKEFIASAKSYYYHFTQADAVEIFRVRAKHSYKGTYGHALLLAGSYDKMGAAILTSKATMRTGVGLLTAHIPSSGLIPLQCNIPEAMASVDENDRIISQIPEGKFFNAIGMGPGVGTDERTAKVLKRLIQDINVPMVLDADALNILSENKTWLSFLPPGTILTPHIGEFRRLLGVKKLGDNYIEDLRDFSKKHKVITVLKDSITTIAGSNGNIFFINEGSTALATAGSGDVLTGIILALLANSYTPVDAALLGVWLHANAGKRAGNKLSPESTMAGDLPDFIGEVFMEINLLKSTRR